MIPRKSGTGLRPIAPFRTQHRVRAKVYRKFVRLWAREMHRQGLYVNTAEGRHCGDRTYRLELRRLAGARACWVAREVVWYLTKAFDVVPRTIQSER